MEASEILTTLQTMGSERNREGMARFGIVTDRALGISLAQLRPMASGIRKELRKQPEELHRLAGELWASGVHEARELAISIEVPKLVTVEQMEAWVADVDSWDVCDGLAMGLFPRTPWAIAKALEWADREPEYVRRCGFAMMASLAFKRHNLPDETYEPFFEAVKRHADDDRNFVKKAVNWALRQIGKRNGRLLVRAIEVAREVEEQGSRSARWIARDALRELEPRLKA